MPATTTTVSAIPVCNICHVHPAYADCFVPGYAWAYVCGICFVDHGCSLGLGRGQELQLASAIALADQPYDVWMRRVDTLLVHALGMDSNDLPDTFDYSTAWSLGATPKATVKLVVAEMADEWGF